MNRIFSIVLVLLTAGSIACCQSGTCHDYVLNSTVTDVSYDKNDAQLNVSYFIKNSYCTGGDEPKYTIRMLTVDLDALTGDTKEKETQKLSSYELPEDGEQLFTNSRFAAGQCSDCELHLRSSDGRYAFVFTTGIPYDGEEIMTLEIFEDGALQFEAQLHDL